MKNLEEIIGTKVRIPSPPAIALRILEVVRSDVFSFKELAAIIEADPALVAKILKTANSAYYGFPQQINSIETALTVIGSNAVKNIALSFVSMLELSPSGAGCFDIDLFWRRAITAAVASEPVSELVGSPGEDIFLAALLQDIGILVFQSSMPHEFLPVLKENLAGREQLHLIEERHFGFNHHELGAYLLRSWHLPESIHGPILHQHSRQPLPDQYRVQKEILILSDLLSSICHGNNSIHKIRSMHRLLDSAFGISGDQVAPLIDAVAEKSLGFLSSLNLSSRIMRPLPHILQDVNEELTSLNTSYEYLVLELKEAKEKAKALTDELQTANSRLRDLAFRDSLTGLYNHRYFQEKMDRELEQARRHQRSFSLIIFDIDHFKRVNDTHGHPAGDEVIIAIGRAAERAIRDSDILARYGGEEFAVILPGANLQDAQDVAERIRHEIETMGVRADRTEIKVTVSVGYTCYRTTTRAADKGLIIGMADRALYAAKQRGRNMVYALPLPGS